MADLETEEKTVKENVLEYINNQFKQIDKRLNELEKSRDNQLEKNADFDKRIKYLKEQMFL